jgi:hypothetical protein
VHHPKPATARRRVRGLSLLLLLPAVVLSCATPMATADGDATDDGSTIVGK